MLRFSLRTAAVLAALTLVPNGHAQTAHTTSTPYASVAGITSYQYHRRVNRLDRLIRMQELEIAAFERMLLEWGSLDRFRTGRPVMVDVERTRLALAEANGRLEHYQRQMFDLVHARGRR